MKYRVNVEYRKNDLMDNIYTYVDEFDSEEYDYPSTRSMDGLVSVGRLTIRQSLFISSTVTEIEYVDNEEVSAEELPTGFVVQVNVSNDTNPGVVNSVTNGCRGGC